MQEGMTSVTPRGKNNQGGQPALLETAARWTLLALIAVLPLGHLLRYRWGDVSFHVSDILVVLAILAWASLKVASRIQPGPAAFPSLTPWFLAFGGIALVSLLLRVGELSTNEALSG